MRSPKIFVALVACATVLSAATLVDAATFYSRGGNTDGAQTWTITPGATDYVAPPTAGDANTWEIRNTDRIGANPADGVFEGSILRITVNPETLADGELLLFGKPTFTLQDVYLDGGALNIGGNGTRNDFIFGNQLTVDATNGGILGTEPNNGTNYNFMSNYEFNSYVGDGTLHLVGRVNGAINTTRGGRIVFNNTARTGSFSGFTGTVSVDDIAEVAWLYDVPTASFDLEISSTAFYGFYDDVDVNVASLTIGGTPIAPGTYSFDSLPGGFEGTFKNYGAGGTAGTLTVGALPEPSSFVLAGLGLVGLAGFAVRRRKRAV
jgi:LPXTG-motif cell wall-anchored protein